MYINLNLRNASGWPLFEATRKSLHVNHHNVLHNCVQLPLVLYGLTFNLPFSWNCITRESALIDHVSYEMYHLMIGNN